jgi:antitoxin component of MazEF toxin-antitoxin module
MKRSTLRFWGNALALRLPKSLVDEVGLFDGAVLELEVDEDGFTARRVAPRVTDPITEDEFARQGSEAREVTNRSSSLRPATSSAQARVERLIAIMAQGDRQALREALGMTTRDRGAS